MKNKVALNICGVKLNITTDDDVDDMLSLASELDQKISSILNSNQYLSISQATIFAALDYADKQRAYQKQIDEFLEYKKKYIESAGKDKTNAERYRIEVERLKKEIEYLKNK